MITLERPNMAVNDPRVRAADSVRRFQMQNTWDIAQTESRRHIVDWVATAARGVPDDRLRHLVLNCHGAPGYLDLGEGFGITHLGLFAAWQGLIEKLWLPNCSVAFVGTGDSDGNAFCSGLARQVQGYVVAATETQCDWIATHPYDRLTSFEGLVLCYGPEGNIVWSSRNPSIWVRADDWMNRLLGRAGQCVPVPD